MTETLSNTYTLYSTSTCTRCPLAKRSMDRAGVRYREVKLDDTGNELLVESIKEDLGVNTLSVPIVLTPESKLLTNLAYISQHFMEISDAKA